MRKQAFTLFEIFVVITLAALAIGGIGFMIPKAYRSEAFERDVQRLTTKLALAHEIMLNYDTDTDLILQHTERGLECSIKTAKPLPENILKQINRHHEFYNIKEASFDQSPQADTLILQFDANSGTSAQGILHLANVSRSADLALKGYPAQICRNKPTNKGDNEAPYPEEILSAF